MAAHAAIPDAVINGLHAEDHAVRIRIAMLDVAQNVSQTIHFLG
jgi:hypothetical protein